MFKLSKPLCRSLIYSLVLSWIFLSLPQNSFAQNITLKFKDTPLKTILKEIQKQSKYRFVYNDNLVNVNTTVSVEISDQTVNKVLDQILVKNNIEYKIEGKQIVLSSGKGQSQKISEDNSNNSVTGIIRDKYGNPLSGVYLNIRNSNKYAQTDNDGKFLLRSVLAGDVVRISMIGMKETDFIADSRNYYEIELEEDVVQLENVVVTGYQTISRERATGSYSKINSEVLQQKPTANISSVLIGLVPGMAVQSSGVDRQTRFIIRGQGTLQTDQVDRDPLIVVDGFPINGYSSGSDSPLSNIKDPFSTINPNDVESITVLKDAAATSIYGARAANGVIVITTKKGKEGTKLDISVDAYTSVSSKVDLDYAFNMASAENQFRFLELMQNYQPISLTGSYDPYITATARVGYKSEAYYMLWERDGKGNLSSDNYNLRKQQLIDYANQELWKKDINRYLFRNMAKQQVNLALRGATEKLNYSFSASYDGQNGYSIGNNNNRIMLNMASSAKLTKNLSFSVNLNTVFSKRENNGTDLSSLQGYISPWSRLTDENGNFIHVPTSSTVYYPILISEYEGKTPASWFYNPVSDRQYIDIRSNNMNYRVQGGFDYKTSWGLKLSTKGQYEYRRFDSYSGYDVESFYVRNLYNTYSKKNTSTGLYESYFPAGGIFTDSGDKYKGYNLRGQADYNKRFGKHEVTFLAGTEIISSTTDDVPSITRYGFNKNTYSVQSTPDYVTRNNNIFGASTLMPYAGLGALASYEERYFSVYANVGYSFNDKLSLTGSFRTDATNYQAKDVRDKFSPFWSVGGSWLISKERFIQNLSWINLLKLRTSVGVAGVSAGKKGNSSVTTLQVYPGNITYSDNKPFSVISLRGNPTLTWEKSRTLNIGLDFGLFTNTLNGSIDYYNKLSYDVLAKATVPVISQGTTTATFNNAKVQNNGIELSLGTNMRIAGDLVWNGIFNASYNNNMVKEYNVTSSSPTMNLDFLEGYPLNSIAVLKPKGYTAEGYIILEGKDGKDEIIKNMTTSHIMDQINRQTGGTIDDLNYTYYLGSYTPKYELGFSNRFTYKGLTLSLMVTGRFNYYVSRGDYFNGLSTTKASFLKHLDGSFAVYDEGYANQTEYSFFPLYNADNNAIFKASSCYSYMYNSQFMMRNNYERGDHIRLQEVYLGYDFPKSLLTKQNVFNSINIYAQVTNLGLIWSVCKDFDPDYSFGTIKPMPTFTFGVKLNFK
jgi:TonB-linked SusC/RagA family outer membrane protein